MTADSSDANPGDGPLERVAPSNITARVPDAAGVGVFATGVLVLQSQTEVMIDFVQAMVSPRRLAARVVMPIVVAAQFLEAIETNLGLYADTFGAEPREPAPVDQQSAQPSSKSPGSTASAPVADAYSQIKVEDEVLRGHYANTVAITHTGSEFSFDFINRGFPRSVVTCRVCMAAPRVPGLRDSLRRSLHPG